jgi:manganese oxidase
MPNFRLTRRKLFAVAGPIVAGPAVARLTAASDAAALGEHAHRGMTSHAAMIGDTALASGEADDLDALLYPTPALPHRPGRSREYTLVAHDREVEVAPGVFFPAWTYNGSVPGPVIRATQDDLLRVHFVNAGSHPHTIHFHGIHPADMDGVFEIVSSESSPSPWVCSGCPRCAGRTNADSLRFSRSRAEC